MKIIAKSASNGYGGRARKILALAMAVFLAAGPAGADAPNLITYQGRLIDNGIPANGLYSMTFKICYNNACSFPGDPQYTEDHFASNQVNVSTGLFSAVIGGITTIPDAIFDRSEAYLEVTVAGSILTPRERITANAYAIKASTAAVALTIANLSVTESKLVNGSVTTLKLGDFAVTSSKLGDGAVITVKLGDGSVTASKLLDGAVTSTKLADGHVITSKLGDGSVTASKLADGAVSSAKLADNAVTTAKLADLAVTTGKLGDAAVTAAKLADGAVTSSKILAGEVNTGKLGDAAVTTLKLADGAVTTPKLGDASIIPSKLGSGALSGALSITGGGSSSVNFDSDTLFIDYANDRVGIGLTNPGQKLDIDLGSTQLRVRGFGVNGNGFRTLNTDVSNQEWDMIALGNSGTYGPLKGFAIRDVTADTSPLKIEKAAQNNTLYLNTSGSVGVGTSSPSSALHVSSSPTSGTTPIFIVSSGTAAGQELLRVQKDGMELPSGGNPSVPMFRFKGDTDTGLFSDFADRIGIATGGVERMSINNGVVGFGVTAPARLMHVRGASGGNATIAIESITNALNPGLEVWDNSPAQARQGSINFLNSAETALGQITYQTNTNLMKLRTNTLDRLAIDKDGQVGIGTTSPGYQLDVSTKGAVNVAAFRNADDFAQIVLRSDAGSDKKTGIAFESFSPGQGGIRSKGALSMETGGHLAVFTANDGNASGVERMRIEGLGDVGIGTTNPTARLEVAGTSNPAMILNATDGSGANLDIRQSGTMKFKATVNSGDSYLDAGTGSNLHLRSNNGASDNINITSGGDILMNGGRVGIATASPSTLFQVGGGTLAVTMAGDIGLGTLGPSARLHAIKTTTIASPLGHFQDGAASPGATSVVLIQRSNNISGGGTAQQAGLRIIQHGNDVALQIEDHLGAQQLTVKGQGLGLGTTNPSARLEIASCSDPNCAVKAGSTSWSAPSDVRLKFVRGAFERGMEAIRKISPIYFRYKDPRLAGDREFVGVKAQEIETAIPEAVSKGRDGYLLVNSDPILWALLNAVKDQQKQIEALQRELAKMKERGRK